MTVKDIFEFLNRKFPVSDALDFDNVGILIGDLDARVNNALITLDCSLETVNRALSNKCNLIITHHPIIFDPLKTILSNSVHYKLIKNGISVISMHTNLDIGNGGVNDTLCKLIGLQNITDFTACDGFFLKVGTLPSSTAKELADALKGILGGCVKFVDGSKAINKVLVCCGSGGGYIEDAINNGFDALITADIKHHQFITAKDNNVSLFDVGHYNSEDIIVEPLREFLEAEFKEINFKAFHPDSIQFV